MSKINGTNIASGIVPFTTDDKYATHTSTYGKGGWHEAHTLTDRDSIPTERRTAGMAVYVVSENKLFILNNDLTTWSEFISASSGNTSIDYSETIANLLNRIKFLEDTLLVDSDNNSKLDVLEAYTKSTANEEKLKTTITYEPIDNNTIQLQMEEID